MNKSLPGVWIQSILMFDRNVLETLSHCTSAFANRSRETAPRTDMLRSVVENSPSATGRLTSFLLTDPVRVRKGPVFQVSDPP